MAKFKFIRLPLYDLLFVALIVAYFPVAGIERPEKDTIMIGKSIPKIVFTNVLHSNHRTFSTRPLNGRPAVLYFISTGCSASIKSLVSLNKVYSMYKDKINFLLIGMVINKEDDIRSVFEAYRKKYELTLPIEFDTIIYKKYQIRIVPNVIWIDESGIVKAITHVMDEEYIAKFLVGAEFGLNNSTVEKSALLPFQPLVINDDAFIQYSMLAEWKPGMRISFPVGSPMENPLSGLESIRAVGVSLDLLYRLAYFQKTLGWNSEDTIAYGNYRFSPILELRDTSKFHADYLKGRNLFCYNQVLPPEKRTPEKMLKQLRRDLQSFFGYEAELEVRPMPYLSLTATPEARQQLMTRGGERVSSVSLTKVKYSNVSVGNLIETISSFCGLTAANLPLLNETEIDGNIDISFKAIMSDLEDVKEALQQHGLEIGKKEKLMKVIVIRDSSE